VSNDDECFLWAKAASATMSLSCSMLYLVMELLAPGVERTTQLTHCLIHLTLECQISCAGQKSLPSAWMVPLVIGFQSPEASQSVSLHYIFGLFGLLNVYDNIVSMPTELRGFSWKYWDLIMPSLPTGSIMYRFSSYRSKIFVNKLHLCWTNSLFSPLSLLAKQYNVTSTWVAFTLY
jgi:hypothetical protein